MSRKEPEMTEDVRVMVDEELKAAITKAARWQNRTISNLIRHLIRRGLEEMGFLKKPEGPPG